MNSLIIPDQNSVHEEHPPRLGFDSIDGRDRGLLLDAARGHRLRVKEARPPPVPGEQLVDRRNYAAATPSRRQDAAYRLLRVDDHTQVSIEQLRSELHRLIWIRVRESK